MKIKIFLYLMVFVVTASVFYGDEKSFKYVQKIDEVIQKSKEENYQIKDISNEIFLRRLYLVAGNRIPTYEEAKEFLNDTSNDKRQKLIHKILNSSDYVEAMTPFWADILRIQSNIKGVYNDKYKEWVKTSIKENKPYDKIVRELITATGRISDNGSIGYYLRDEGNVLEIASTTAQIFLGTQIGCAQCHNHPFEEYTQKQFYEFTAYLGQVSIKDNDPKKNIRKGLRDEDLTVQEKNILRRIMETASFDIRDLPKKELHLPADYKYDDAKPNDVVKPKIFIGEQPIALENESNRMVFAKWLTSSNNPYFTKIIVNRLWKKTMGFGLFEPVDDFNNTTKVVNKELLTELENIMKEINYDMKLFQEILLNSKYFSLPTSSEDYKNISSLSHDRPLLRMKSEQVWNSLLTLTRKDINEYFEPEKTNEIGEIVEEIQKNGLTEETKTKLLAKVKELASFRESKQDNNNNKKKSKTKKETVDDKLMDENELKEENMQMNKEETKMMSKQDQKEIYKELNNKKGGKLKDNLIGKASEIVSPAPEQHFLNFFGQSDRLIIEEGNTDPNLLQVLALLNSPLTNNFIVKNSIIKRQVNQKVTIDEKIDYLYTSILTRSPSEKEKLTVQKYLKENPKTGIEDLIWVLVNKREFIFIQ